MDVLLDICSAEWKRVLHLHMQRGAAGQQGSQGHSLCQTGGAAAAGAGAAFTLVVTGLAVLLLRWAIH